MSKGIDLKERYKTYLRLERGLSPNSIDAYLTDVDKLFRFANEEGKPVTEITYDDLRQFIARLCDIGIHPRSQARILSGIKSFYGFLIHYRRSDRTDRIAQDRASPSRGPDGRGDRPDYRRDRPVATGRTP